MGFNCWKATILACSNILGLKRDTAKQVWSPCERVLNVENFISYVIPTSGSCDPDPLPQQNQLAAYYCIS